MASSEQNHGEYGEGDDASYTPAEIVGMRLDLVEGHTRMCWEAYVEAGRKFFTLTEGQITLCLQGCQLSFFLSDAFGWAQDKSINIPDLVHRDMEPLKKKVADVHVALNAGRTTTAIEWVSDAEAAIRALYNSVEYLLVAVQELEVVIATAKEAVEEQSNGKVTVEEWADKAIDRMRDVYNFREEFPTVQQWAAQLLGWINTEVEVSTFMD